MALAAAIGIAASLHAEVVDRIVAVVGGSMMTGAAGLNTSLAAFRGAGSPSAAATVITWSSVFEEANYQAFRRNDSPVQWKPADPASDPVFREVLQKMIDQILLQQELQQSPFAPAPDSGVEDQLQLVQKKFPDDASYRATLARYHLSEEKVAERLTRENILFAFVDSNLRPQAHVADDEIEKYYQTDFLRGLEQQPGTPNRATPALADVRDQIEELLVQREIGGLLDQWLQQLRRGARIEIWPQ